MAGRGSSNSAQRQQQPQQHRRIAAHGAAAPDGEDDPLLDHAIALAGDGRLLTRPDGPSPYCNLEPRTRSIAALFEDGLLLYAAGQEHTPEIRSLVQIARAMLRRPPEMKPVSLGALQRVYSAAAAGLRPPAAVVPAAGLARNHFDQVLRQACTLGANDVHIQHRPGDPQAVVRMRIDGAMHSVGEIPPDEAPRLINAAFAAAQADASAAVNQGRAGQIDDIKRLPPGVARVRLQSAPTGAGGTALVIRLHRPSLAAAADLVALGFEPTQAAKLHRLALRPAGAVFIAGHTGMGKTTTLQCLLTAITRERRDEAALVTVEDPQELDVPHGMHLQVLGAGDDLADREAAFRARLLWALRLNPDILVPGEVRDRAAASVAFDALLSGHQVLTTLHAGSALGILDRLSALGVERYKLADAELISGLVGQRLVRRLCRRCAIPFGDAAADRELVERARAAAGPQALLRARGPGCAECRGGYAGLMVVAEVVRPDDDLLETWLDGHKHAARARLRKQGEPTMLDVAIARMRDGLIDPAEVEARVDLLDGAPQCGT